MRLRCCSRHWRPTESFEACSNKPSVQDGQTHAADFMLCRCDGCGGAATFYDNRWKVLSNDRWLFNALQLCCCLHQLAMNSSWQRVGACLLPAASGFVHCVFGG